MGMGGNEIVTGSGMGRPTRNPKLFALKFWETEIASTENCPTPTCCEVDNDCSLIIGTPCGVNVSDFTYELVPSEFLLSVVSLAVKSAKVFVISNKEIPSNVISDIGAIGARGISIQLKDRQATTHHTTSQAMTPGNR
jgi:hypothetical protein